ncbi:hypothetical protein ABW20_dc0109599 [Dactylellina cionopaga]|nr:hypothetical protein ABW20_dc0109599 [Dactylellina cionopaga]
MSYYDYSRTYCWSVTVNEHREYFPAPIQFINDVNHLEGLWKNISSILDDIHENQIPQREYGPTPSHDRDITELANDLKHAYNEIDLIQRFSKRQPEGWSLSTEIQKELGQIFCKIDEINKWITHLSDEEGRYVNVPSYIYGPILQCINAANERDIHSYKDRIQGLANLHRDLKLMKEQVAAQWSQTFRDQLYYLRMAAEGNYGLASHQQIWDAIDLCLSTEVILESLKSVEDPLKIFSAFQTLKQKVNEAQQNFENTIHGLRKYPGCECFTQILAAKFCNLPAPQIHDNCFCRPCSYKHRPSEVNDVKDSQGLLRALYKEQDAKGHWFHLTGPELIPDPPKVGRYSRIPLRKGPSSSNNRYPQKTNPKAPSATLQINPHILPSQLTNSSGYSSQQSPTSIFTRQGTQNTPTSYSGGQAAQFYPVDQILYSSQNTRDIIPEIPGDSVLVESLSTVKIAKNASKIPPIKEKHELAAEKRNNPENRRLKVLRHSSIAEGIPPISYDQRRLNSTPWGAQGG